MNQRHSRTSVQTACDFLLERLVHQILRDDPRGGRELLAAALDAGAQPQWLLAEILWPAAECLAQLRHDRMIGRRTFNQAASAMSLLIGHLDARLAAAQVARRRRLLILSAPGEPYDLGAHLLSILAEASGFEALFAGAGLSGEEILFAVSQLDPDAIIIHGSVAASRANAEKLVARLQTTGQRPRLQIACAGSMLGPQGRMMPLGDLSSLHPVELLELLALCPDHRGTSETAESSLRMPEESTPAPHAQAIDEMMRQMFPPRMHLN